MPRTPAKDLYADFIDCQPVNFDLSEVEYRWWEGLRCENCSTRYIATEQTSHCPKCGDENFVYGPVFNYSYPIEIDRVGRFYNGNDEDEELTDEEKAAMLLADLPLALLEMGDSYFLNLTGGGQDLSWEICEGFMVLGYLPPTHFANLPRFAGAWLDARRKWVLSGISRALRIQLNWTRQRMNDVKHVRASLLEEKKKRKEREE